MAKRRKLDTDEGTARCFYCGKDVPENAWRCPYCSKWYRDGKEMVGAIVIVGILVLALVGYTVAQFVDFPGEEENGGQPPVSYSVDIWTHGQFESHNTGPGRFTSFMIFVRNTAQVADTIDFSFSGAATGLDPHLDYPSRVMAAGSVLLNILTVDVDSSMVPGSYSVTVKATSRGDSQATDSVDVSVRVVNLQPQEVVEGDHVTCNYILWRSDGGMEEANDGLKVYTGTGSPQMPGYTGVIDGFKYGLLGMKITETNVVAVPPNEGYTSPDHKFYNQWLYFQITLVSIDG